MLRVSEIFASIQGETSLAGFPFAFVRLAGCNLRCRYCDTTYAYEGGETLSVEDVVARVGAFGIPRVTVTGGEPLLQEEAPALIAALLDRGHAVFVETNGTVSLSRMDPRARTVMDVKCPGSGEGGRTKWENFERLSPEDEVKFVVASEEDYRFARDVIRKYRGERAFTALLSPAFGILPPERLAGWMVADALDARMQVQLHKIVWGPDRRGV